MYKAVFVILHYLTTVDTLECIESIKKNIKYKNYEIVVVDNASNNGSFETLKEKYKESKKIHLIKNDENLGFAKGNNVGYIYAKNKLNADFIFCINNDTIIEDEEFIDEIVNYYNKYGFHVLGPNIISLQDNCKQNYLTNVITTKKGVVKNIIKYSILLFMNVTKLEELKKYILKKIKKEKVKIVEKKDRVDKITENVPLHGSCIILSKDYINMFDYAFYPETFLYIEEDILFYLCKKNNLKTVYFPNVTIYHKEDSSTDFLMNTESKKRRFLYKNILKSLTVFYKIT